MIKKISFLIFLILLLIIITRIYKSNQAQVFAEGGIEVTFTSSPLFDFNNLYPGAQVTGRITVTNITTVKKDVGFILKTNKSADFLFTSKLSLKIKDPANGLTILGGQDGKKLTALSLSPKESTLFSLNPGEHRDLDLVVTLDPNTGNFYQGRGTNFDFSFGFIGSNFKFR